MTARRTETSGSKDLGLTEVSARTRARILEAAAKTFSEEGYHGATMRLIASRAGIDPALPFRYFTGKPGLFEAVLAAELDRRDWSDADQAARQAWSERLCRLLLAACWAPVVKPPRNRIEQALKSAGSGAGVQTTRLQGGCSLLAETVLGLLGLKGGRNRQIPSAATKVSPDPDVISTQRG